MAATVLAAPRFNLKHTLESGQFFRWTETEGSYDVLRGQRYFRIRQDGDTLGWGGEKHFAPDSGLRGAAKRGRRSQ